ncbi:neuropeptides B/W receptor type 2 [Salminus brasiliensis]|uniref:neuropeptides B/W receptor type 2 n=1 Tax=Salminus brasiliensis TaxID=930266 RepID=UPI003B830296
MDNTSVPWLVAPLCDLSAASSSAQNCTSSSSDFSIWLPLVYSLICVVGLAGNTAVICVIARAPRMKSVTNVFILNLAIADDLFALVLPASIAEHVLRRWPFGELACKAVLSIDHYNIFSSVYFVALMSADRYAVVATSLRSKRVARRTRRLARTLSACVWALVVLLVAPYTFFAGVNVSPGEDAPSCVLRLPRPEPFWFAASRIYTLVLSFLLPVSTICVLYGLMLHKLRRASGKALDRAKRKVTMMVSVVLAVCLLCWTPFHLSTVVALTAELPNTPLLAGVSYFITCLSYANSCLNPFLYAFLDDSFRREFRKMLRFRMEKDP